MSAVDKHTWTVESIHAAGTGPHPGHGEAYVMKPGRLGGTFAWWFCAEVVLIRRASAPVAPPAIIPETEQARRVEQYAAFRAAVETACPVGCRVVVDMLPPSLRRNEATGLVIFEVHGQRHESTFSLDAPSCVGTWMDHQVRQADVTAGERMRRGT